MYEVDGEEVIPPREPEAGVSTPEPIKVTKVKKKKVFILSSSCWVFPCLIDAMPKPKGTKSKSSKVTED